MTASPGLIFDTKKFRLAAEEGRRSRPCDFRLGRVKQSSGKGDEQRRGPDLGVVHLARQQIHRPVSVRAVLGIDLDLPGHVARRPAYRTPAFEAQKHVNAQQVFLEAPLSQQFGASQLHSECRAVHERVALGRIADLHVTINGTLNAWFSPWPEAARYPSRSRPTSP